jgi:hypothetical protein
VSRFPIRFEAWYAILSSVLFLPPSGAYVEVEGERVRVRMGWAFRAEFPRAAVASVRNFDQWTLSRGVHGFAGRWLVNGSGKGILDIALSPDQAASVLGFPIRLKQLYVSVDDPAALAQALGAGLR